MIDGNEGDGVLTELYSGLVISSRIIHDARKLANHGQRASEQHQAQPDFRVSCIPGVRPHATSLSKAHSVIPAA